MKKRAAVASGSIVFLETTRATLTESEQISAINVTALTLTCTPTTVQTGTIDSVPFGASGKKECLREGFSTVKTATSPSPSQPSPRRKRHKNIGYCSFISKLSPWNQNKPTASISRAYKSTTTISPPHHLAANTAPKRTVRPNNQFDRIHEIPLHDPPQHASAHMEESGASLPPFSNPRKRVFPLPPPGSNPSYGHLALAFC